MTSPQMNAITQLRKEHDTQFERNLRITKAHTISIDTPDSCQVAGRPGYKWVREYGAGGGVFQCIGVAVQDRVDLPVLIGYEPKPPFRRIILDVDWSWIISLPSWGNDLYSWADDPFLPNHHTTHEWPDYEPGIDVVNVYPRALTPLRTYPGTAGDGLYPGLSVNVAPYTYELEQDGERTIVRYPGDSNIDISHHQPSDGFAVMVLVYLDINSDTIITVAGDQVADTPTIAPQPPSLPLNSVLSALVRLDGAATAIAEEDITDIRQLWNITREEAGVMYNLYYNIYVTNNIYMGGGYPFNVITVDANDTDADYDNLNDALNASSVNDVISVGPGTYTCTVLNISGRDLIGHGAGVTIISVSGTLGMQVGSSCVLQDFSLHVNGNAPSVHGIDVVGNSISIYNVEVVVTNSTGQAYGIYAEGAVTADIIRDCIITASGGGGASSYGVYVSGGGVSSLKLQNSNVTISGSGYDLYAPFTNTLVVNDTMVSAAANGGVFGNSVDGDVKHEDGSRTWWKDGQKVTLQPDLDFQLAQGVDIYAFSDDGNMSGNSDSVVPTERAVRSYVRTWTDQRAPHISNTLNYLLSLPGLAALWTGAANRAGTLVNLVPNGLDLVANGGAYISHYADRVPIIGFDGVDDYFSFSDVSPLDFSGTESIIGHANRGLTLMAWIRMASGVASGARAWIDKYQASGNNRAYTLRRGSANQSSMLISSTGAATTASVNITTTTPINSWVFVAGRFRPSIDLKIWENMTTATSITTIPASIFDSSAPFYLGQSEGASYHFGNMAYVALCMYALPNTMVENVYNYSSPLFA